MRRVSAKFVPRLLTEDQQFQRLATSSDLFQSASDDPKFMKLIITGDESWTYGYDPETKQQSSQWKTPGSPRPNKARQVSKIKVMLIVFFDADGIVHHEISGATENINAPYPCKVRFWAPIQILQWIGAQAAHHWYAAKSPGLSIQCRSSRAHQTALARFRSGHLRSMTLVQRVKSFFTSPCSLLASPAHLLDCWDISMRQLYEEQGLVCETITRKGQMDLV
ncbi:uncharacterized protein TNCV_1742751 [Trichonephila clavipes]|nr:uncharacterized protein TNCV_1742751 [Trichonephila clavipes]